MNTRGRGAEKESGETCSPSSISEQQLLTSARSGSAEPLAEYLFRRTAFLRRGPHVAEDIDGAIDDGIARTVRAVQTGLFRGTAQISTYCITTCRRRIMLVQRIEHRKLKVCTKNPRLLVHADTGRGILADAIKELSLDQIKEHLGVRHLPWGDVKLIQQIQGGTYNATRWKDTRRSSEGTHDGRDRGGTSQSNPNPCEEEGDEL